MEEEEVIRDIVRTILGDEVGGDRNQMEFDCPVCSHDIKGLDHGDGKGNLAVNIPKGVYKCWACGDEEGTKGSLRKMIKLWGTKEQLKLYDFFRPAPKKKEKRKDPPLALPKEFIRFKDSNPALIPHKQALKYLYGRGITDEMILKHDLGYAATGDYGGRIIFPSYDAKGKLNFFVGRTWHDKTKNKYKNPPNGKESIIFNEWLIDFNKDIYLVEGVFDSIFLDNSIPLLGKVLNEVLLGILYEKAKGDIVIVLDGDAPRDLDNIFDDLNGGKLFGRVRKVVLPKDEDVATLKGNILEYEVEVR